MALVSNVKIYDLEESVIASGYPMKTKIEEQNVPTIKDYERGDRLADNPAGSGHNNFLSGVLVSFDLTASVKMWTEAERYHFLQLVSSQSTMHRLTKMDLNNAFVSYTDPMIIERLKVLQKEYEENPTRETYLRLLYSCPTGIKLTCRVTTNYLQLKTIYQQRRNHRLPEWREFCAWIETLPYAHWIVWKEETE